MRLRNKNTGEIIELDKPYSIYSNGGIYVDGNVYDTLAELNEEWEDYKEREWNWYIDWDGEIKQCDKRVDALLQFETKEEAEKAVEKLKTWQRLKDKGFRFTRVGIEYGGAWTKLLFNKGEDEDWVRENLEDLRLLFGGEE